MAAIGLWSNDGGYLGALGSCSTLRPVRQQPGNRQLKKSPVRGGTGLSWVDPG
jgi:hypothetical protein